MSEVLHVERDRNSLLPQEEKLFRCAADDCGRVFGLSPGVPDALPVLVIFCPFCGSTSTVDWVSVG